MAPVKINKGQNGPHKYPLCAKMYGNYSYCYFLRQKTMASAMSDSKTKSSTQILSDVSHKRKFSAYKMFSSLPCSCEHLKYLRLKLLPSVGIVHADDKASETHEKGAVTENESSKELAPRSGDGHSNLDSNVKQNEFRISDPVTDEEVRTFLEKETGWDRIRMMYSKDPVTNNYSLEIKRLSPVLISAFLFGSIYSTLLRLPVAKHDHKMGNQVVKYAAMNPYRMARARYDYIIRDCLRTGFKYGSLLTMFIGSMVLTARSISVYRNKTSMMDYTVGGVITGALFRIHIGARAMLVGGLLLGTIATVMQTLESFVFTSKIARLIVFVLSVCLSKILTWCVTFEGTAAGAIVSFFSHSLRVTQDKLHFEDIRTLMEMGSIIRPRLLERKSMNYSSKS